jgi:MoaA/NifB/PqqE/SkfB family radical SAM enzyme
MANWDKIRVIRKKEDMQVGQIRPMENYTVLRKGYGGIDKDYTVTFRITEACDLKCNYCHWHSGTHYTFEDIVTSIDKLFEFFQKQKFKTVNFYYHGGEATRHPRVLDVLKYIKQKGAETGITAYNEMQTNLTIQEEKLRAMLPYCDQFNVSYHYLELLTRNKLEAFDRNWQVLKELNVRLHNFDVMLENVERDHKYYAGREIKIEADDFYSRVLTYLEYENIENSEMIYGFCHYEYPDDIASKHMEFYKKYNKTEQQYIIDDKLYTTNDLFKQGIDARGWHCAAGTESITINGDGNVFHCGIHMTNFIRRCTPEIPYTNLVQDKLAVTKLAILYKTGTICKWDYCGGDFYLSRNKRDGV